jgi:hypothetical protein
MSKLLLGLVGEPSNHPSQKARANDVDRDRLQSDRLPERRGCSEPKELDFRCIHKPRVQEIVELNLLCYHHSLPKIDKNRLTPRYPPIESLPYAKARHQPHDRPTNQT